MKKVVIISCTRKFQEESNKLSIYRSFVDGKFSTFADLDIIWNNSDGMPKCYNSKLQKYKDSDYEFAVFVHDDVYIDDMKLYEKLNEAHSRYGYEIVGLAGGLNPRITNPALWHIMTERNQQRGEVAHPCSQNQVMTTSFGPTPSRVAIADGLFFAVHLKSLKNKNWKFNENYNFHHYDIASCIDANRAGIKIGVYPIHAIHQSPGLLSIHDKMWSESNEKFLKEYSVNETK